MNNFINYQNQIVELIDTIQEKDIDKIWPAKHLQNHFKSKLDTCKGNNLKLFFELSYDNQRIFLNYLNKKIPKDNIGISKNTTFKPTIKDKLNGQINLLYFFANHKHNYLEEAFKNSPEKIDQYKYMPIESNSYCNAKEIYQKMPSEDRETLLLYVDKNYCAFNHFKTKSQKV